MRVLNISMVLTGLIISSCSTFSHNSTTAIDPNKILPSYASPHAAMLNSSIESSNSTISYLAADDDLTTEAPIEEMTEIEKWKINNYNPKHNSIDVAALDIDYQNRNLSDYPLLSCNLNQIIPERFNQIDFNNPNAALINPITLNPSPYNIRTLQMDNLELSLETTALLSNRKNISKTTPAEIIKERAEYLNVAQKSLEAMYKKNPELQAKFESAVAFGVFEITNFNVLLYVGAYGKGVIFDNKQHKVLYMNTVRAGTGPGLGYESMYIVFVFKNEMALKQFIGAKGGGGDIGASATLGIIGEQISFNPEIGVYQFYRNGFDLQANWGGTLYMPAMSLND